MGFARAIYTMWGSRRYGKDRTLTEHEGVREERRECDEEAAEAASNVGELGSLARASKGGIVGIPVELVGRGRVAQRMV